MKEIYIIGNSGFAKEVYELINDLAYYKFAGFIDYKPKSNEISIAGKNLQVFDEDYFLQNIPASDNISIAVGIGDPVIIAKVTDRFAKYEFPNLIHPSAKINLENNKIGKGNIITANVIFTLDITVGNYNVFNLSSTVGHDAVIGNCNVINPAVNISGGVIIGDQNLLGVGSTILQYKTVGNNVVVGASSLVTKDVADNATVVGIPAKTR